MSEQNTAEVKTEIGEEWWENRPRTDNVNRNTTFFGLHSASFTCLWPLWVLWCYTVPTKLTAREGWYHCYLHHCYKPGQVSHKEKKGYIWKEIRGEKTNTKTKQNKNQMYRDWVWDGRNNEDSTEKKIKLICFIMYISSETWAIR